jgi:hypothetical protein
MEAADSARHDKGARGTTTSIWLPIIAVLLLAHLALSAYEWFDARQRRQHIAEVVASQAAAYDTLLITQQAQYEKAVYDDPAVKGIAHQQFRAIEFTNEYLRTIIRQNNELMHLLATGLLVAPKT